MFERFKNRTSEEEGGTATAVERDGSARRDAPEGERSAAERDTPEGESTAARRDTPESERSATGRDVAENDRAATRGDAPADERTGARRDVADDDRATRRDMPADDRTAARRDMTDDDRATRRRDRTAAHPRGGGVTRETMQRVRARQREEYGGINWGSAFFGWLVAVGVAVLLTGILAAAGAAIGLTETTSDAADSASPETLSAAGAIALIIVLAIAYYCGGYVAGRMSRFDGARQGIGTWVVGLLITIAVAVLAVVAGSEYNVVERANLPRLPIGDETLTIGGAIASVAILLGTLLFAALGGIAGARYHHKVDRAGYPE